MKLHINKKDIIYLLLYLVIFIIISYEGIFKYVFLSGIIAVAILKRKSLNLLYFKVIVPSLIYICIGSIVALVAGNLSFYSVKQILIYLCSGLFSIIVFSIYTKKNTIKLLDIQFVALCIAYLILYARYFSFSAFYHESNLYAYIFGAYALLYFCQNRKRMMILAVIFMLFDHKRIADAAFIVAFIALIIVYIFRKEKHQRWIKNVASLVLFLMPILWVFFCSNGILASVLAYLDINTMGRLEGTGAWNLAKQYYKFSPLFLGNGIGFITEWLGRGDVFCFNNLHNDFLTGFIELGFFGFLIWIISFQVTFWKNDKHNLISLNIVRVFIGFMFLNFLTDNIYLYVTFLVPFYLVLLSMLYGEDKEKMISIYRGKRGDFR